jgi:hypothetical protein
VGRKRKFQDGVTRSFILPADMIADLKQAARLRGVEVPDVLRQLIAADMTLFMRESRAMYRQRVHAAIDWVKGHKVLAKYFDQLKDQKDAALPFNAPLTKHQRERLALAVTGFQDLRDTLSAEAENEGLPLLERLVVRARGQVRRWLLLVWKLVAHRELRLVQEDDGDVMLQIIGPLTGRHGGIRARDDEAVAAFHRLISYVLLRTPHSGRQDSIFKVNMKLFEPERGRTANG